MKKIRYISKSKCSAQILFGDIKNIIIQILPNLYRSKVDRLCHYYLQINFQYCENGIILKYNSHIYYNIKSILV